MFMIGFMVFVALFFT